MKCVDGCSQYLPLHACARCALCTNPLLASRMGNERRACITWQLLAPRSRRMPALLPLLPACRLVGTLSHAGGLCSQVQETLLAVAGPMAEMSRRLDVLASVAGGPGTSRGGGQHQAHWVTQVSDAVAQSLDALEQVFDVRGARCQACTVWVVHACSRVCACLFRCAVCLVGRPAPVRAHARPAHSTSTGCNPC